MNIKALIAWCIAHPELAVVAAGALLSIPGAVYALVKTAYQAITGRPAKGSVWTVLDVVVEVLPNLPGAINRAVRGAGLPSIFAPPASRAAQAAPPPSDPQRGTVRVCVLVSLSGAILVATLAGAVLAGCPAVREGVMRVTPGVPDPSGCAEGAQRCSGSVPEVCSASHRWWPALPRRADGTQRVCAAGCAVTDAGVAVCAALDGGAR